MKRPSWQNPGSPQARPLSHPAPEGLLRRFGYQISRLRKRRGWSQRQLAQRLRMPSSTLSRYETAACEPGLTFLVRLARVLGLSLDQLVFGEPVQKPLEKSPPPSAQEPPGSGSPAPGSTSALPRGQ